MSRRRRQPRTRGTFAGVLLLALAVVFAACTPSPEANVITHLLAKQLGTFSPEPDMRASGSLVGTVHHAGEAVEGAAVVVGERYGTPHAAYTDDQGRYRIDGIPPGQYVPAAVAVAFDESAAHDRFGLPRLVTIESDSVSVAPEIELSPHQSTPLPSPLAEAVQLSSTGTYTASAPFPPGSEAQAESVVFEYKGVINDSVRVYLPIDAQPDDEYPLLFVVYPGPTDNWKDISVPLAAAGYAVVAMAPAPERGLDIDGHAMDARIALHLAREGALGSGIDAAKTVVMGGSFSSPILRRFLRDESDNVAAWITLGGISDGYSFANDFYRGAITVPVMHDLAIPSLGLPNLYPLPFLRLSSIYTAGELPPTLIIHTASDEVTPIDQAYLLEDALKAAQVPVEAYYYEDVTHYLIMVGEEMSEATEEMYYRVLDFVEKYTASPTS